MSLRHFTNGEDRWKDQRSMLVQAPNYHRLAALTESIGDIFYYSSKNEMMSDHGVSVCPLPALPQNVANVLAPCFVIDTNMAELYA